MAIDQCREQDNDPVKISHAQKPWQSLKWQYRLQHSKRIRWPEDQEPNKTSRVFNIKAKLVCNLPFSKTSNLSQLLFKTRITTFGGTQRPFHSRRWPGYTQQVCRWTAVKVYDDCHRYIAQEQTTTLQLSSSERNFERRFTVAVNEEWVQFILAAISGLSGKMWWWE